jgi:hypothetical protein
MAKLVVEVHDASDLMPKDGQGSASPFVEIDLDEQKQRTQTKQKDLNPYWNEKLVFNLKDRGELHHKTIEVVVYNDRKGGGHKNFLGRVRISGDSVLWSESEATIQRYPLDKRGLFSHIKGDIALRIYISNDASSASAYIPPPPQASGVEEMDNTPLQEINANNLEEQMEEISRVEEKNSKKKKKKEKEVRTFHSLGTAPHPPHSHSHSHPPQPSMVPGSGFEKEKAAATETRTDFARAQTGPAANVMQMQAFPTRSNPEFGLVETRPPLAARQRYQ